jgi:uncharacterized membrane protein HdeD (DUF308 family)
MEGSGKMKRRILAWVLLVGFIFLIVNIVFIGFYRTTSLMIYILIALYFIFTSNRKNMDNP